MKLVRLLRRKYSIMKKKSDRKKERLRIEMETKLYLAMIAENVSSIRDLVNSGANLNRYDAGKLTPLLISVDCGYFEVIPVLLELGANLEMSDRYGRTPLHIAARKRSAELLKMMLPYCSEEVMNLKCKRRKTAVMYLLENPRADVELLRLFVEHGADLNVGVRRECSAIHCFIKEKMENFDVFESLLQMGADPNIEDENRNTPLQWIYDNLLENCNPIIANTLRILLKYGARMYGANYIGAPHTYHSLLRYIEIFIDFDIDLNLCEISGSPLLHTICYTRNLHLIELLLTNGADINLKNRRGRTSIQLSDTDFMFQQDKTVFSKLWEHIFILRLKNKFVAAEIIELFERQDDLREENAQRCSDEIDRLKEKIIDGELTLYQVAMMNKERCFRNQTILEMYRSQEAYERICNEFPIFSTIIQQNIERIFIVSEIEEAIKNFDNPFKCLTMASIDEILRYFTFRDLKSFWLAFPVDPATISFLDFKYSIPSTVLMSVQRL